MILAFIITAVCIVASGFFSGSETGMYCFNRMRVRFRAEQGQRGAVILQRLASDLEHVLATILVGNNLTIYCAAAAVTGALGERDVAQPELLATIILTPLCFLLAELLPKDLFERKREALMCPLAPVLLFFTWLLWPIVAPLRALIRLLLSSFHRPREEGDVLFSRQGLTFSLADASGLGTLSAAQRRMAHNIMQVEKMTVADVFRPLDAAQTVSVEMRPEELLDLLRQRPYSRVPVYDANRERIVGIVNVFDVVCGGDLGETLQPYVKPAMQLDRRTLLYEALLRLRAARQKMAVVVDGRQPIGIVTVNDLVHQSIGRLEPSHPSSEAGH